MKPRAFFLTLALLVIVSLAIASGGVYWVLAQSPLSLLSGGVTRSPLATAFVPKQTTALVSLLVSPNRLEAFSQWIAQPAKRRQSQREIREFEQSLLAKTGLNYRREVQPWLGEEVTLAVTSLDYDRDSSNGSQPGYLLVVETQDPQLSKEFLQLSYTESAIAGDVELVSDTYQGVNITYKRPLTPVPNNQFLAQAVVGNYVLFANHPKVLREALNTAQAPELSLGQTSAYQAALKTIDQPRIGLLYANFPALSAWLSQQPKPAQPEITQTLTVTLALKAQGLLAQTALIGVNGEQSPVLNQPVSLLTQIPEQSLLTAASRDLQQFWQQVETALAPQSPLQGLVQGFISQLQMPLGLDFARDIFPWVQGEYALAFLPPNKERVSDWIFLAERLPNVEVDTAIAHLDDLARQQGYTPQTVKLGEQEVTAWTKVVATAQNQISRLETSVAGVHGVIQQTQVLASSLEAFSQVLLADQHPLTATPKFQQAIAALPLTNNGYFYVDWNASEPLLQQQFPFVQVLELGAKPLFKNLRSLTLSNEGSINGIRRNSLYINLGVREPA
ncbi:MAG: DUF3352 domain-containing protein [Microcystaceae cyanobacterium]